MSKKTKYQPVTPPDAPKEASWEAARKDLTNCELPRPLPIEFTPRQMSYLFQLVASDSSRIAYRDDPVAQKVISETHTKLMLVQRAWFDDLETAEAAHKSGNKAMVMSFKATVPEAKP